MGVFHHKPEHIEYIRSIAKGRFLEEIRQMFNEHFGLDLTVNQVRYIKKGNGITSGVHGAEKGTAGRFQKGQITANHENVGTVKIRNHVSGVRYHWIKVAEPNVWKMLHKYLWEKENGAVPESHVLYFVDGNTMNCTLDNIVMLPRKTLMILNHWKRMTNNAELNRCIIAEAELSTRLYELGVRGINSWNTGERKKKC